METFELRESGTRRLLGVVTTAVPMSPGDLVVAFRQDQIQVERALVDALPPATGEREPAAKPSRKRGR